MIQRTDNSVEIIIEDQGEGFHRAHVPDPTAEENLYKCSGRGVLLIESYMDGTMLETLRTRAEREMSDSLDELRPEEAAILALLQQRLTRDVERVRKDG